MDTKKKRQWHTPINSHIQKLGEQRAQGLPAAIYVLLPLDFVLIVYTLYYCSTVGPALAGLKTL